MVFTTLDPSLTPVASIGYQNIPNILDNGSMEIWQRGISFANPNSGTYAADRWVLSKAGAGTPAFTISRESGAANVDSGTYSMKLDITSLSTMTQCQMVETVEDFAAYKGKTLTLSVRIKTSTSAFQIAIFDGVTATFSNHSGSGNFETITVTKTLSASTSVLQIGIGFVSNQSVVSTSYIDSAMLVIGSTAISFVPTNPEVDFARCQRYYQRIGGPASGNEIAASGQWWSTTLCDFPIRFPVVMRATPTVTPAGISGWKVYNAVGSAITPTGIGSFATSASVVGLTVTVASGGVAGNGTILYATAPTSYLELSADL